MRLVPWSTNFDSAARNWPASRIFEEFFSDVPFRSNSEGSPSWRPAVDILEKEGNLVLRAEVPGMNQKDIELKLEGNVLTLKGERKLAQEGDPSPYHRLETFYGTFSRSFTLPETVDLEHIKADYRDGILTITIPQKPEVKPRAIPVN
jgi:HSP20 family protein